MVSGASRASPTRVTLLLVLLAATMLVASLLGYEAHSAARAERLTAERALREYASMAAWEFESATRKAIDAAATRAFGAVTGAYAVALYEPAVPLDALRASAERELPCANGEPDPARLYARLDLRSGASSVYPESAPAADAARLLDAMRGATGELPSPESPHAIRWGVLDAPPRAVVVGVRYVRLGTPLAMYAFTVCASAIEERLARQVLRTHALLPASVSNGQPNDSLLDVTLKSGAGRTLARIGNDSGLAYRAAATLADAGGLTAELALRREAVSRLLVGPPQRSRVALLIGLLALTAALAGVALVQIRREHELARLRADFTSSVSHELRTPLAQILLFGETLSLDRARTPADRRLAADTIVHEARRLMHMVDNILHFARARRGTAELRLTDVDLVAVVRDVALGFTPLADAAGARIALDVGGAPVVVGEAGAVRQVLLNLLDNAVKYGPRGQEVRIVVRERQDGARVTIEDEGSGVAHSDRERVWMPYVRLTTGGGRGGSGLGLAVVRELMDAMGGRAWVEDAARGGAAFCIELRRASSAADEISAPRETLNSRETRDRGDPPNDPPSGSITSGVSLVVAETAPPAASSSAADADAPRRRAATPTR